ncbi:hypothetical protein ABZ341_37385 [Streptomyces sp. NPDC006173]|uniref:hypothetical protein n=1 Tax=Streptomyces sp. NPDC006173 TaxID=3155349 RepID=UPI0034089052
MPSFVWATGSTLGAQSTVSPSLVKLARDGVPWFVAVLLVTVLTWHGGLFVVHGVLVEAGVAAVEPDLAALTAWYLYLWGPWFIVGGLAFAWATALHVRQREERGKLRLYGAVGALGALALSVVSTATGVG